MARPTAAQTHLAPGEPGVERDLRAEILVAATQLFARRGYGQASVREVVEAVGCTKPVLYYYFGSKEGLFLEAVRTHMASLRLLIEQAISQRGTVRDRLVAFVRALLDHVHANPDVLRLLITAQHRPERGQPQVDLMSLHRENRLLLGELLAEGVSTGEIRADVDLTDAVLALLGIVNLRSVGYLVGLPTPDDLPERILALFFDGVSP